MQSSRNANDTVSSRFPMFTGSGIITFVLLTTGTEVRATCVITTLVITVGCYSRGIVEIKYAFKIKDFFFSQVHKTNVVIPEPVNIGNRELVIRIPRRLPRE